MWAGEIKQWVGLLSWMHSIWIKSLAPTLSPQPCQEWSLLWSRSLEYYHLWPIYQNRRKISSYNSHMYFFRIKVTSSDERAVVFPEKARWEKKCRRRKAEELRYRHLKIVRVGPDEPSVTDLRIMPSLSNTLRFKQVVVFTGYKTGEN